MAGRRRGGGQDALRHPVITCRLATLDPARPGLGVIEDGVIVINGNRIAGLPQHVYRGELRYSSGDKWFAGVNVEIGAGDYYADHENEVSAPGYTVVGFSAGYRMGDNLEIYASGENLTGEHYAAGLTPVLSQELSDGRLYTPGVGASLYGGLRYRF